MLAAGGTVMWPDRRHLRGIAGRGSDVLRVLALGLCGGVLVATSALMLVTSLVPPLRSDKSYFQLSVFWGTWVFMLALPVSARWRRHGEQPVAAIAGLCLIATELLDVVHRIDESLALAGPAWIVDAGVIFMGAGYALWPFDFKGKTVIERTPISLVSAFSLAQRLVSLHPDATAKTIPFRDRGKTDANWIIGVKSVSDDASVHAGHWERHPHGEEVLCLLDGRVIVTLLAENEDERQVTLIKGEALVVPRGAWHRLHVEQPGRLMFITPSVGSEHRRVEAEMSGVPA